MSTCLCWGEGDKLLHAVLIANKVTDDLLYKNDVLCKVHMEKAYDHVNWGF